MTTETMTRSDFKQRSDIHLARKLWHFCGVLLMLFLYLNVSRETALNMVTILAVLFISNDLLRHNIPALNNVLIRLFKPVMREHERHSMAGTSYLTLGAFVLIVVFPKPIVILSLLFLAVADPVASYVGIRYGKDRLFANKSLQGSLAAFVCCAVISTGFYYFNNLMTERLIIVSLLSGLVGAIAEAVPIARVDDNFTIPVLSASLLYALFYLFGGF